MRLVLLRHTQTAVGSAICYGDDDVALAETHATDISECVQQLPDVDHIISSPLARCHKLANAVSEHMAVPLELDPRLKEMNFGRWQGTPWDDVSRPELDEWAFDYEDAKPHGGESVREFRIRLRSLLTDLQQRFTNGERLLLVTHAGVIRSIRTFVEHREHRLDDGREYDERDYQIDYGQWTEVVYQGTGT